MKHRYVKLIVSAVVTIAVLTSGYFVLDNIPQIGQMLIETKFNILGYPQNEVLLVGSSSVDYWMDSAADLGPLHTINVGVGGTVVTDWIEHVDQLIVPFQPRAIVMYLGSNDIDGSDNSKPGDVVALQLDDLFNRIHKKLPDTQIYYISISPTPKRWHVWRDANQCNQNVKKFISDTDYIHYIDTTSVLLGPDNKLQNNLYRDGLHFNKEGYALWASIIRPVVVGELEQKDN